MDHSIDVEFQGEIALVRPKRQDLGPDEADILKECIRSIEPKKPKAIVINFSLVEYMSSVFLSALMELYKELEDTHIGFGLAEMNRKNLEIVKTTRLDSVFPIFSSVHDACASLKGK